MPYLVHGDQIECVRTLHVTRPDCQETLHDLIQTRKMATQCAISRAQRPMNQVIKNHANSRSCQAT